jgi:hypothetical protein
MLVVAAGAARSANLDQITDRLQSVVPVLAGSAKSAWIISAWQLDCRVAMDIISHFINRLSPGGEGFLGRNYALVFVLAGWPNETKIARGIIGRGCVAM